MANETRFYSWEQLGGATRTPSTRFNSIGNKLLANALTIPQNNYPYIDSSLSRSNSNAYPDMTGGVVGLTWERPAGYTSVNMSGYLQWSLPPKEKGIVRWGMTITRAGNINVNAPCVKLNGTIIYNNGKYEYISTGLNTKINVYVEVEVNWATKQITVYLDDVKNAIFSFETLTSIQIGSFDVGIKPIGSSENTVVSWAFPKAFSSGFFRTSNIYVSYWDGEDEDQGRLGPISCIAYTVNAVEQLNGKLSGFETENEFLTRALSPLEESKGIVTNPGNEESIFSATNIKDKIPEGQELLGVTLSAGCSYTSTDLPVNFTVTVNKGSDKLASDTTQAAISDGKTITDGYPKFVTVGITPEDLNKEGDLTIGVSFKRLSDG